MSVLVVMISMRSVSVSIVNVVHVVVVLDRLVAAARAVCVLRVVVNLVLGTRHGHEFMRTPA